MNYKLEYVCTFQHSNLIKSTTFISSLHKLKNDGDKKITFQHNILLKSTTR